MAQRVGRGIALLSHDRGTRRGEWSAARPGRTLPRGKARYPFYRRLVWPQGRSGRAENLVPTGIQPRTFQPVVSRYTDWATSSRSKNHNLSEQKSMTFFSTWVYQQLFVYTTFITKFLHNFFFVSNYCFEIIRAQLSAILKQLVNWPTCAAYVVKLYWQHLRYYSYLLYLASLEGYTNTWPYMSTFQTCIRVVRFSNPKRDTG